MSLHFALVPEGIVIEGDSNLSDRLTSKDRARLGSVPVLPGLPLLRALVRYASRWVSRAESAVRLLEAKRRLARLPSLEQGLDSAGTLALSEEVKQKLRGGRSFHEIYRAWPERAHLMCHALAIILRFAPERLRARGGGATPMSVVEIGSGSAILTGLLGACCRSRHILIDLPEQIVIGFSMLSEFFPEQRTVLPNEIATRGALPSEYDIVFLTPEQVFVVKDCVFDVAVNMFPFGEMSYSTIDEYFSFLRRHLAADGIFYCANRVAKANPHDDTTIEFARYPWLPEDAFLFDRTMEGVFGANASHRESVVRLRNSGTGWKSTSCWP